MRIDSHHHLWRYRLADFGWIPDGMASLRRDFLWEEFSRELDAAAVDGAVLVQAEQTLEGTEWLLRTARQGRVLGVVGWAPIASPTFPQMLDRLGSDPLLKGLRHVVQAEPDGFFAEAAFRRGFAHLQGAGLAFDLLVYPRQLPLATAFVDLYPAQVFVLDHMGKPDILHNGHASWAAALRELARRPNVCCKVSGLVTEAGPFQWTPEQLRPYLDTALEAFGPGRLMIGSDWPVCTVGCRYGQWWQVVEDWAIPLSASERFGLLGQNALRTYKLHPGTEQNGVVERQAP